MRTSPRRLASLARKLYGDLGAAVAAYFLRCDRCGAEEHSSREEMVRYFRGGWPTCCGETMKLTAHGEVGG